MMASTKKVLKSFILYCKNFGRLKFRTRKNFGRFYFRTLFLSEIKIVRNFLQVMYLNTGVGISWFSMIVQVRVVKPDTAGSNCERAKRGNGAKK